MTTQTEVLAEIQAIKEVSAGVRDFLKTVFGHSAEQLGLLLGESVQLFRFQNQLRIADKARQIIESRGIDREHIKGMALPEVVLPLLDAAQVVRDEDLGYMFAGLLASSVVPETLSFSHPSYVVTLQQLSPLDAKILKDLYETMKKMAADFRWDPQLPAHHRRPLHWQVKKPVKDFAAQFQMDSEIINLSLANGRRLGLLEENLTASGSGDYNFTVSPLGYSFLCACFEETEPMRGFKANLKFFDKVFQQFS